MFYVFRQFLYSNFHFDFFNWFFYARFSFKFKTFLVIWTIFYLNPFSLLIWLDLLVNMSNSGTLKSFKKIFLYKKILFNDKRSFKKGMVHKLRKPNSFNGFCHRKTAHPSKIRDFPSCIKQFMDETQISSDKIRIFNTFEYWKAKFINHVRDFFA